MARIAVIGTLDSKREEFGFFRREIEALGHEAVMIDTGLRSLSVPEGGFSARDCAKRAGFDLAERLDSGLAAAIAAVSEGAAALTLSLCREGKIDAAFSMGGGQGTALASGVMRALPIGFPKLLLSTLANMDAAPFRGVCDTALINPVVDVAGLNPVLRLELRRAAAAICAMASVRDGEKDGRKTVAMTMFGATTPCCDRVRRVLEEAGVSVLAFHATGVGGETMEKLIAEGKIDCVADITVTEIGQELLGGVSSAGPRRMEAAGKAGIPQVVSAGAADMVNFFAPETMPEKYRGRRIFAHNPSATLMRTSPSENREIGRIMSEKLEKARGPVSVLLPSGGVSVHDREGGAFYDPEADEALFSALEAGLGDRVKRIGAHINDPLFADAVAGEILRLI